MIDIILVKPFIEIKLEKHWDTVSSADPPSSMRALKVLVGRQTPDSNGCTRRRLRRLLRLQAGPELVSWNGGVDRATCIENRGTSQSSSDFHFGCEQPWRWSFQGADGLLD